MTSEVKERIDQIRRGIVPEGYIKSKDGIYPGDWTSKEMGQWLQLMERPISLEDEEKYELVTVRRGFGGVDSRGTYLGKNVLVKNYFCLCTGDYVISKRQIAHGACGVVPAELDGAVVSNEYNVFIPQEGTNINMFNLMMQLPHYRRLFYLMSDGVHIEKLLFKTDDWMRRSLAMPSLEEQERIASILSMQDKIIELEQQKIEEIKKAKRFFLEKMFPKEGQAVPEIRFKGFTAPWEQRKVSELFRVTRGYVLAATQTETTKTDEKPYPVYSSQTKDKGLMGYYKDYLYEDAITWTTDGANAGTVNYRAGKFYCTNVCGVLLSNEVKANQMIAEALNSVAKGYVSYVGNPKLMNNVMADIVIQIPTQAEEREQLSSFFAKLDNLITLHQRILEEEKRKKKALMQLLLTGLVRVNA